MNHLDDQALPLSSVSLAPINYFAFETECHRVEEVGMEKLGAHFQLLNPSIYCNEETFATVALGWSPDGLCAEVDIQVPFQQAVFPDPQMGDSVELFIDTRDMKSAGFNTRFCHHFCFLPVEIEGLRGRELTHFRTEDAHDLCDPTLLQVKMVSKKKSYGLHIFIPTDCLYGYDPGQFDRLGFTYRINRYRQDPQHFSVISTEYQIDQHPALWSSLRLVV